MVINRCPGLIPSNCLFPSLFMYVGEYYIQNILKDRRKESEQEIIK